MNITDNVLRSKKQLRLAFKLYSFTKIALICNNKPNLYYNLVLLENPSKPVINLVHKAVRSYFKAAVDLKFET